MEIKNTEKKTFNSFDKNHFINTNYIRPSKFKELESISKLENNLINVGSNLSYSPLSFAKKSISLELRDFNRVLDFNLKDKEITVEAGMNLAEFLNFTLKHNLWIPQIPGYPFITLGGAVATNAHGKSCALDGTIKNSIKSMRIFHKKNGWINLSKDENRDIFDLTIGGIGLTGTIVDITFKLKDIKNTNFITKKNRVSSLEECIQILKNKSRNNNSFIYSWNMATSVSNLGNGIVFENLVSDEVEYQEISLPEKRKKNYFNPYLSVWNKLSISAANQVFLKLNNLNKKEKKEKFLNVIFPFYGKENYFNFFGKKGFLETQLLLPENTIDDFLKEFKYLFKRHQPTITLLSFKNMSGQQKYFRFEDNMICMTLDFTNNKNNHIFMRELDKLCVKYQILPSIIKDSRLDRSTFEKCYQYLSKFKEKINEYDPNRIYKSETSERLGL